MNPSPFVFIASPVSSPNPYQVLQRIETVARFAAWVQEEEQKCPFAAAVHDIAIGKYLTKQKPAEWWQANIRHFMEYTESCYVLCLDGWEKSSGVALEISAAHAFNKPVFYYKPVETSFQRVQI